MRPLHHHWMSRALALPLLTLGLALALGCAKKPVAAVTPPPVPPTKTETPPTPPPTPTTTIEVPSGSTVKAEDFSPAFFDYDSYTLRDDARVALDKDARVLRENAQVAVTIEGHCDERGTVEYNQALGERRAQAARDYLVAQGINASRLTIISYGKERPFATGSDEASWQQNRRAHFTVRGAS